MNTSDIRAGLDESDLGEFSRWATEIIPQMCDEINDLTARVEALEAAERDRETSEMERNERMGG